MDCKRGNTKVTAISPAQWGWVPGVTPILQREVKMHGWTMLLGRDREHTLTRS